MRFNFLPQSLIAALLLFNAITGLAGECSAKSGNHITPLLELYTSEGCSSCPPADKWISTVEQKQSQVTPLAFHVDYWDYIGWKDAFANPKYSQRQRNIAHINQSRTVYTPQFVLNGHDFRGWNHRRLKTAVKYYQDQAPKADLQLKVMREEDGSITLTSVAGASDAADARRANIFVALYENGLTTEVQAGENSGRKLKHDYVVRNLFGAYSFDGKQSFEQKFTLKPVWQNRDAGAVIFVQDKANGELLQSLALPFCDS